MTIEEYLNLSKHVGDCAEEIIWGCIQRFDGSGLSALFTVHTLLFMKVLRCHGAIQLLAGKGFSSEAGSVAVTEFEVLLDMLFIEGNEDHSQTWQQHESSKKQPLKVRQKIESICGADNAMRENMTQLYEQISMIKHANPKAGPLAFPIREDKYLWMGETGQLKRDAFEELQGQIILSFSNRFMLQALEAAVCVFAARHFLPESDIDQISELREKISAAAVALGT